jgi:hypothetical protein
MSDTSKNDPQLHSRGNGSGAPIPDPGNHLQSKYARKPTFAGTGAILRRVPVTVGKPKSFCRSLPHLTTSITLVDLAKSTETGKRLHLITPEAVEAGALENLQEAFNAEAVPMIDRWGTPFVWPIRQHTRDGIQLESYEEAMKVVEETEKTWVKFWWVGGGYQTFEHPQPHKLALKIPPTLVTQDDWIEAGWLGRLITPDNLHLLDDIRGDA